MANQPKKYSLTNPFSQSSLFIESLTSIGHSTATTHQEPQAVPESINLFIDVKLPIHEYREEIIKGIRQNKCIVFTGSTGCGKTTQVPKFIIQDAVNNNESFNILVSQPRKIAAITNASRVAQEMNCSLGTLVGFQVGLDREASLGFEKTRLLYCTTGVILQKLIRLRSMKMFTHIILDEIHERDVEMDFLLILIRNFLNSNSPNTKIILMSATVNSEHFASYFQSPKIRVPIVKMKVQRNFRIEECFLNQLLQKKEFQHLNVNNKFIVNYLKPGISNELMQIAAELVFNHVQSDSNSSILIFLPGLYEIESFEKALLIKFDVRENFQIIVLHSAITSSDQKLAFKSDGKPKIILSTNVAENSVTIPKVNVVIDFCLTKYLVATQGTNLASLDLKWSSKTSSEQRAGRTGRVCDGIVYHLVGKQFYDEDMPLFTEPEMKRVPLASVVLKAKLLANETPLEFLSYALDPPDSESVRGSILLLKEIGALQRFDENGEFQDEDGELTFCGRIMACLPCDIYIAKFIILGYMFSVLQEVVIIAAGLTINGSVFRFDYNKRIENFSQRLSWSDGSGSDLLAIFNAYNLWRQNKRDKKYRTSDMEQKWCKEYNLDIKNLNEVKQLVGEFKQRLEESNIKLLNGEGFVPILEEKEKPMMIKVCVAGAWLPFYYLQDPPMDSTERNAHREVGELNVHRTVIFKDSDQPYTKLYDDMLKKAIVNQAISQHVDDIKITFDENLHKIFVTFVRDAYSSTDNQRNNRSLKLIAGSILPEVYVACKYRELTRGNFHLDVMNRDSMKKYAEDIGYIECDQQTDFNLSASSFTAGVHKMTGVVTHVEHCGKFFFRPTGRGYDAENRMLQFQLRKGALEKVVDVLQLSDGEKVVVSYKGELQRAIVKKLSKNDPIRFNLFDLGLVTKEIPLSDVLLPRNLKKEFDIPQRCFECRLKEIAPSPSTCPQETWTVESIEFFRGLVQNKEVQIKIFSVVDEFVSVTLFADDENINKKMIRERFAVFHEEDYNSRNNHDRRSNNLSFQSTSATGTALTTAHSDILDDDKPKRVLRLEPPSGLLNYQLKLFGPSSPLESHLIGVSATEDLRIKIDSNSVNSIVLNGNISSSTPRLYVAANVCKNQNDGITLREVTMMPYIPGLAEILALIFCPKMILRCDEERTRFVGLQTGLGCSYFSTEALLPLHDAIFSVNVQLTNDDFSDINQLRACMSELVFTPPKVDYPELNNQQKHELQLKIKNLMSRILEAERNILAPAPMPPYDWVEDDIEMIARTDPLGNRALYGLHDYPELQEMPSEQKQDLKINLSELEKAIKSGNAPMSAKTISCKLCNVIFNNKREISDHLMTVLHKTMVKQQIIS